MGASVGPSTISPSPSLVTKQMLLCSCDSSKREDRLVEVRLGTGQDAEAVAVGSFALRRCDTGGRCRLEVIPISASAECPQHRATEDLVPLQELIRDTPGVHPIASMDELRCDAFETDRELDDFLAFVTTSRHADLA